MTTGEEYESNTTRERLDQPLWALKMEEGVMSQGLQAASRN